MSEPALSLRDLRRDYNERPVLRDVSLALAPGETLSVIGPNGAGKSTLLRILATLLRPSGGEVELLGADLPRSAWKVRGRIGYLGHEPLLYRELSVRENLEFNARLQGVEDADRRIDELLERGGIVDGHLDIASAYVLEVFPDILGLSKEGRHHLLRFGDAAFNAFGPANEIQRRGMERAADAIAWVDRSVKRSAVDPEGLGGQMFKAADAGEITEEEAELLVRTLFAAGSDTTIYGIGSMVRAFSEHPGEYAKVRAEPKLVRNAFEEVLRYESPSRFGGRATKDVTELDGVTLPAGARIMVMFLAAGRDPRRWENADTFDVTRKVVGHINLGYGIHACAGQALARIEGQAILNALAAKVKAIEPAGEAERAVNFQAHGHEHIPVRLIPA